MTNGLKCDIIYYRHQLIIGGVKVAFFIVLLIIDVIVGLIYAKKGHPKVDMTAFWLKMLASGMFVFNGLYLYLQSPENNYGKLIVIGLVCGMVGDALLSFDPFIKKNQYEQRNMVITTVIGAAAFLAGHVVYIVAFVKAMLAKDAFNPVIYAVSMCIIAAVTITVKTAAKVRLKKLLVPFIIYSLGLASMASFSISLALNAFQGHLAQQAVLCIGPILFMISDASLGMKFSDRERFGSLKIRYVTLFTYYVAQMLIGYTISFV